LKENATRFHFPVPQQPGMSSSDADSAYSAGKNDARAVWAGEGPSNGKREFHLHEVSAQVKISSKSLAGKKTSPCEVVADRLAYWLREAEEREFVTGAGSDESLGLFTCSALGISNDRDFISGNGSFLTGDDFKGAVMMLEPQYRGRAHWILHPEVLALAMKLTDSLGISTYKDPGRPIYQNPLVSQSPQLRACLLS